MASGSRPKYDSYQSRRKVAVSSSSASAPSARPSARRRADGSRRNVEPTRKTTEQARKKGKVRPRNEKQKLADIKREERQRRQRERFVRRVVGITLICVVLIGVIVGAVALINSSLFDTTTVNVTGTRNLSKQDIKELANVSSVTSLLLLDKEAVAQKIIEQPWVKDVQLTKSLPHTLVIKVIERTPQAVVEFPGSQGNKWLISSDGIWLGVLDEAQASTIPQKEGASPVIFNAQSLLHIGDVPSAHPREGIKSKSSEVINAIRIINGLSPELRKITERVSAPSVPKTKIFTKSGIEIALGSSEDIEKKDRIARSILAAQKDRVVLINVRSIEAPTWRGVSE